MSFRTIPLVCCVFGRVLFYEVGPCHSVSLIFFGECCFVMSFCVIQLVYCIFVRVLICDVKSGHLVSLLCFRKGADLRCHSGPFSYFIYLYFFHGDL